MEPGLRFPGTGFNFRAQALLPRTQFLADFGTEPVMLRGLDQEPARMAVAGLGDVPLTPLVATGVFARHQAQISHELPRVIKAQAPPSSLTKTMAPTRATPSPLRPRVSSASFPARPP